MADRLLLSIVVPAYNEEEVLAKFHFRLNAVLSQMECGAQVVYVNDGSTDRTVDVINFIRQDDERVALVDLSRNFGKEIAMTAGFDQAKGDAVVVIDADLQDPPELIPELLRYYQEGFDIVYAQRISRSGEGALKKVTAFLFYRLIQAATKVNIPADTGDFRLLSRRALQALGKLREQHRFMKGLYAWIGFPQKAVAYHRDPRKAGQTKWNYWKLWNFALEGFTSFTIGPLKVASYLGLSSACAAFLYAVWVIYKTIAYGDPVAGYPSLMVAILFLGSVQLITIGVLGEYLGRMFDETKQRPLYFVKEFLPARNHCAKAV
jgi:glycosyltransferase involved in cell wall biosynthesis